MTTDLELYKKLYLIRCAEQAIIKHYASDVMKTPMHMSMGGEAISVGVCAALDPADQVLGTYRSHALYLAKTGDTDNFFLEMYGKKSRIANGKDGSMHLCSLENGLLCCSAIVGSTIPVAVGVAFANKYAGNNRVVAVFFGDGAIDEGVFYESLNFACLKKLPILFIYEDNGLAVHSFNRERRGMLSIVDVVQSYNLKHFYAEALTPRSTRHITIEALSYVRRVNPSPAFIHFVYHRYLEHVGVREDYRAGYRDKDDARYWYDNESVRLQRSLLTIPTKEIMDIESEIEAQVERSVTLAQEAPFADPSEVYTGVYR